MVISIVPDLYPEQTTWKLYANDIEIANGNTEGDTICLDSFACVRFAINDLNGNGICCNYGEGSYTLIWDGLPIVSGNEFQFDAYHAVNCTPGSVCENPLTATTGTNNAPLSNTYFSFTPDSSGMYSISSCSTTVCDTKIWIYGNCGQVQSGESNTGALYFNDNNSLCNEQASIEAYLVAGTPYIIRIANLAEELCPEQIAFLINYNGALVSQLPIIKLTTLEAVINNEEKVPVRMQIIDNGIGQSNFADQTQFAYEGNILAEWQGFTSQVISPKKNYDFDLIDLSGNKIDASLLGLPAENDWLFKAEYVDNSLIRNTVSYALARKMGRYAPRTRQCEMFLDGTYIGVYTLTEKVKRDNNRVDIANLTLADTSGSDLSGGYIIEINRNGLSAGWNSVFPPIVPASPIEFKYVYPDEDEILPVQASYIKTHVDSFEHSLHSDSFLNPQWTYRRWIDVSTFIDYQLMCELSLNVDSYQRSIYLYKEKDTDGGKLCIGPIWDFDRAFMGNPLSDWLWDNPPPSFPYPFWWSKFNTDTLFMREMACRWTSLRNDVFKTSEVLALVDSSASAHVSGSAQRNFSVWQTLENTSYEEEIVRVKNFIIERFDWLDSALAQFNASLPDVSIPVDTVMCNFSIYEAPFNPNYTYDWMPGPNEPITCFTATGLYTLDVRDSLGCYAKFPMHVSLSIPDAIFQVSPEEGAATYTFTAENNKNGTYTWNFGDNSPEAIGIEVIHTYADTGVFQVTLVATDSIGCYSSFSQNVYVNFASAGAKNHAEPELMCAYPNPCESEITINIDLSLLGSNFLVLNAAGIVVLNGKLNSTQTHINFRYLPNGVYLFCVGEHLKHKIKLVKN